MLWDRISLARAPPPPALRSCSGGGLALRTSPLARALSLLVWLWSAAIYDRVYKCGAQILVLHASIHPLGCPCPLPWEELGVGSPLRRQILGARHRVLTPA